MAAKTDNFGRLWNLPNYELCPVCGQPDNCGDCNHEPLTETQVIELGGFVPGKRLRKKMQNVDRFYHA